MFVNQIGPGERIKRFYPKEGESSKIIKREPTEFKNEFWHLLIYDYDQRYKLVIDTFNHALDLIDAKILFNLFEQGRTNDAVYQYMLRRFTPPNSEEGREKLEHNYNKFIREKRNLYSTVFDICPTYSCNMRCNYCYQKNRGYGNQLISHKELKCIFDYINNNAPANDTPIVIELFGGEPLQKRNKEIILKVFSFCKQNDYPLAITTNGSCLYDYLDLLVLYNRYILKVATTLDGVGEFHNLRRNAPYGFDKISRGVDFLLNLGIDTDLYTNVDYENLDQLPRLLQYCEDKNWLDNDNFKIRVGRVDDRCFENLSDFEMSESDLLYEITLLFGNNQEAPKNFELAFLKTALPLAKLFGIDFGQNELRAKYHYCWATSPFVKGFSIDDKLDVYRCSYSVGNKDFSIGNIKRGISTETWEGHFLLSLPKCLNCPLGGYCSGGCYLSSMVDPERRCLYEKDSFNNLIKKLIIPKIKMLENNNQTKVLI